MSDTKYAENDYHKQISKDLQSSYDLGCITTIEKIIKLNQEDVTTGKLIYIDLI